MNRAKSIEFIRQRFHNAPLPVEGVEEVPLRDEPCEQSGNADEPTVPPELVKLFALRHAARAVVFRPMPQPGQILRINPTQRGKDSRPPCDEPLAVLLDAPIAGGKWRGWLVGRDPEYATVWDLILGPEENPRDPQCEVVQIWNPVTITIAEADRVLAELSDERLAAARSMDNDCTRTVLPAPIHDTRMGVHLARELSDGIGVVTGTPLAAGDDPRREYQENYREAGIWVSQGGVTSQTERGLSGVIQGGQNKESSLISRALALGMAVLSSGSDRPPRLILFSRAAIAEPTPEVREAEFKNLRSNLEKAERSQGLDHPDVAYLLMDLANWYEQQGRHAVAESLYKRSLAIYEKVFAAGLPSGKDKLWIRNCARQIEQLAATYQRQGRHADAENLFKRSLAIYENVVGATDQNYVVDGLRHLALFYESQSRYAEAESQYDRLLSILENYYHSDEQVAEVLKNIGLLYQRQGRHADAESLLKLWQSIQSAPESMPEPLPGPFDWLKRIFTGSDSNWWKPAATFAALLIVPLLFILMRQDSPQTPQIAISPDARNRYVAGGDVQELHVVQPELKARELENRLRAVKALPEIRYETGGTISVEADLKAVAEIDRNKLYADFGLKAPTAGMLRVLFVAPPAVPEPGRPGKSKR